jgi:hypothetical protein
VAQKSSEDERAKKPVRHQFDDEKLENMVRYYNLQDNYDPREGRSCKSQLARWVRATRGPVAGRGRAAHGV